MSELTYTIKNLTVINIDKLINISTQQAKNFCDINGITYLCKDGYKLTLHYFLMNFFLIYKGKTTKNILCYTTVTDLSGSKDNGYRFSKINKKIVSLIMHKPFNFPTLLSNISIEEYINLISLDSPEYDEAINNNFDLIDNFLQIKQYIKKSQLIALEKKYENLTEELNLLLNI